MSELPVYNSPTLSDVECIGKKLNLQLEEEDLKAYKESIDDLIGNLKIVDKYASLAVPVTKYHRTPGRVPLPEENELNGWARIVEICGASSGPLRGRRIAIKDNTSIAGVPLGNGSKLFSGYTPNYDATVVTRVLDAGATISGIGNCEDLCLSINSFSSTNGPIRNPYNKLHSAGGSSGGNAALVASSAVDMAVGTDQGGSIRGPSSYCGIVGLKPTYGLVPYTGITSLDAVLDHVGPMAKTVKDCALLLQVLAGYDNGLDPRQPSSARSQNYIDALTGDLANVKIGLVEEGFSACSPEVQKIVTDTALQLNAAISNVKLPILDDVRAVGFSQAVLGYPTLLADHGVSPTQGKGFKDLGLHDFLRSIADSRNEDLPPSVKSIIITGTYFQEHHGHSLILKTTNASRYIAEKFNEIFSEFDVLIMPTMPSVAPRLPETDLAAKEYIHQCFDATRITFPFNVTGNPAISVNAGFHDGLPVGMMIVGRLFEDASVLNVAYAVEQLSK